MSDTMQHICWVLLLLSGLLPLTLRALKRVWIKVSVWHRFEPDFVRSFRTFFFGGLRENVNYAPPWENMWIVITCGLTIVLCDSIASQLLKLLPGIAKIPDVMTKSLGIFGLVATSVGFYRFLRRNRPERRIGSREIGSSKRYIILIVLFVFAIALSSLLFVLRGC